VVIDYTHEGDRVWESVGLRWMIGVLVVDGGLSLLMSWLRERMRSEALWSMAFDSAGTVWPTCW